VQTYPRSTTQGHRNDVVASVSPLWAHSEEQAPLLSRYSNLCTLKAVVFELVDWTTIAVCSHCTDFSVCVSDLTINQSVSFFARLTSHVYGHHSLTHSLIHSSTSMIVVEHIQSASHIRAPGHGGTVYSLAWSLTTRVSDVLVLMEIVLE